MNKIATFILITLTLLSSCKSKKAIEAPLQPKPLWITERPFSTSNYYGIGVVQCYGPPEIYKAKARQNALSDIASQINSKVSSVSVLYQVEDKKTVNEILQNRIESKSNEFLEGYILVDTYTDATNYYECYQLSKELFAQLKEKRKTEAMQTALQLYNSAQAIDSKGNAMKRIIAYTKVLEQLNDYLSDNTTIKNGANEVNLNSSALDKIHKIINDLNITSGTEQVTTTLNGTIPETELAFTVSNNNLPEAQIPIKFSITGNYLRADQVLSNEKGIASTNIQKFQTRNASEQFCASINVEMISRIATKNIAIRLLIKNCNENKKCINIVLQ